MIICDTHCDTLFSLGRRPDRAPRDVSAARLREGGISMQAMAMFVGGSSKMADIAAAFDRMEAAIPVLKDQWQLPQVTTPLEAVEGQSAFMLTVEGCDLMDGRYDVMEKWLKMGVRMAALTWNYENCIGVPACKDQSAGLKPFGKEAVRAMAANGIALDTSHLSRRGFYELLEMGLIPLASHSCCDAICPCPRNLTDDQLKSLFSVGGYVGVNFYPAFLSSTGKASLQDVVQHILHMIELGGEGMVGFGSDFDGIEVKPAGLDHPGDVPKLLSALKDAGLSDAVIEGIAGQNLLAYYRRIGH